MPKKIIAIAGAGLAGVYIASRLSRKLRHTDYQILLFNDGSEDMTLQSVLPQIAVGTVKYQAALYNLKQILKHKKNVEFINQEVIDVDFDRNILMTRLNDYQFDYFVAATGSFVSDQGIPGALQHATFFNSFKGAMSIRKKLTDFVNLAKKDSSKQLNLAIVGGGPSGVELAAELANFKKHQHIKPTQIAVTLVNADQVLLPSLTQPEISQKAKDFLTQNGIEIINDVRVIGVNDSQLTLENGQRILTDQVYWAAGLQGQPIANHWGLAINEDGQITVDEHFHILTENGNPLTNAFAAGNIAAFTRNNKEGLPQLALAIQYAGNIIVNQMLYHFDEADSAGKNAKEKSSPRYFVSLGKSSRMVSQMLMVITVPLVSPPV
ncbi:NADH dehydrogenase [Fructobacillus pseudoficulneus]|uniref:NADH:ubiquinone reductase (non-electrogenic) n=1 Tax=Fructobacillus pseudoficulneus TaxID=220714 RepID=A0A3F3H9B8_9LACO|nr:FAD-dependent oxidoreductase [Fructobacillus pseudoficulneus]GAP02863.1 NADH dehydrogenase [Fructobacillus pseudoficulneus]SEH45603.1 NADH dehydrogenase, FAD-containing subunit [Fructobacillus pseudoficulneus]